MLPATVLQIPGGVELLAFNVVIALVVGYFVYRDASRRTDNAALWAVGLAAASLSASRLRLAG